ncbi:hypothetical protein AK821_19955 [Pseudomonas sp. RIT-PI-r]|nr:hypothetical protein AK821_19955 [Pseudomonas sp. RIT-PI-r]
MNAVYEMIALAGALCVNSLAVGTPIRGAMEISWGIELHDNELYGAVVANSYHLESTIAKYPRIVVGPITVSYLMAHEREPITDDKLLIHSKNLAKMCLSLLTKDKDDYYVVDYLGENFKSAILQQESQSLFIAGREFARSQHELHKSAKNKILEERYEWLLEYFENNSHHHI